MDSEINPYTGEKVPTVDSSVWGIATASELYKQLSILEKRFYAAQTLGKVDIQRQLQQSIAHLKGCIAEAVKRDGRRPVKKRPNHEQQRHNDHRNTTNFD